MAFKVDKTKDKPELRLVSFRLPVQLMNELQKVASKEKISATKLVRQMIEHCIKEIEKQKK